MRFGIRDELDLEKIADSGQCFRWKREEKVNPDDDSCRYLIVARDHVLSVCQHGQVLEADCSPEEFDAVWRVYFDLDENYAAIRSRIDPEEDPCLYSAAQLCRGIRILRQDPWEMLISFLIAQNRNIPAIKKSIGRLSEKAGHPMEGYGENIYSFPEPEELAALSEEELRSCRLGYRAPYIYEAAQKVASGKVKLSDIAQMPDKEALLSLKEFKGIGDKVASCILLFGFHRLNAFPVDVWVRRAQQYCYPDGFPFERFRPYCGVMQQYLFMYFRQRALLTADPPARR